MGNTEQVSHEYRIHALNPIAASKLLTVVPLRLAFIDFVLESKPSCATSQNLPSVS
jgi:hypothetical protein